METKTLLPRVWEVPQVFRDRLGSSVGRQRVMAADGHLLLVLHAPPEPGETTRQGRFLWRKPDGTWTSNDLGGGPQVVAKHLDQFAKAVHDCDVWEEQAKTAEDYFAVLERLAPIQRSARNLHRRPARSPAVVPGRSRLDQLSRSGLRDRADGGTAADGNEELVGSADGETSRRAGRSQPPDGGFGAPPESAGGVLLSGGGAERHPGRQPRSRSSRRSSRRCPSWHLSRPA